MCFFSSPLTPLDEWIAGWRAQLAQPERLDFSASSFNSPSSPPLTRDGSLAEARRVSPGLEEEEEEEDRLLHARLAAPVVRGEALAG